MSQPTASQVFSLLKTALEAAAPFAAKSVLTLRDRELDADKVAINKQLDSRGMVLAVSPLIGSRNAAQAAARMKEEAVFLVEVRTNPTVNDTGDGAQIDHDDACDAVIRVVLGVDSEGAGAIPGAKLGNGEVIRQLLRDDRAQGLLITAINFTVPLILSKSA